MFQQLFLCRILRTIRFTSYSQGVRNFFFCTRGLACACFKRRLLSLKETVSRRGTQLPLGAILYVYIVRKMCCQVLLTFAVESFLRFAGRELWICLLIPELRHQHSCKLTRKGIHLFHYLNSSSIKFIATLNLKLSFYPLNIS